MKHTIGLALVFALTTVAQAGDSKVKVVKNIAYDNGDPVRHKLDLYLPAGKKDFPVLFFIHGGGWKNGSKDKFEQFGRTFAEHGIGTVTTNYRLYPKVKPADQIQDVAKAFAWTYKNIGKYGGRKDRIFVSGHSAGGHLAALLATNNTPLESHGLTTQAIRGAIPISGVYLIPDRLEKVFGDEEARKIASPINYVNDGLPKKCCSRFLFIYAAKDIPNCDAMSKEMTKSIRAGISKSSIEGEANFLLVKDRDHGTVVRNIPNEGDPTTTAIVQFIRKHTGAK